MLLLREHRQSFDTLLHIPAPMCHFFCALIYSYCHYETPIVALDWRSDLCISIRLPSAVKYRPLAYRNHDTIKTKSEAGNMGNYLTFRLAMPHFEVCTKVLLTRSPLVWHIARHARNNFYHTHIVLHTRPVRLACLIHAASVHPELGSNSQNK